MKDKLREHSDGHLFRNLQGSPWKAWGIISRFCRLQLHLGSEQLRQSQFTLNEQATNVFAATLNPLKTVCGKPVPKTKAELRAKVRKKLTNQQERKHGIKFCLYAFRHICSPTGF